MNINDPTTDGQRARSFIINFHLHVLCDLRGKTIKARVINDKLQTITFNPGKFSSDEL